MGWADSGPTSATSLAYTSEREAPVGFVRWVRRARGLGGVLLLGLLCVSLVSVVSASPAGAAPANDPFTAYQGGNGHLWVNGSDTGEPMAAGTSPAAAYSSDFGPAVAFQ